MKYKFNKRRSIFKYKPCKNQEFPEFCEFFMINDLKAQLLARTTLICNLKKQIKSVKETSNEAKVKNDIDVIETINIELEHSVAKLLAANEQLHKENEHLKQTYKELFDSIKKTRIQNKDNSESLISPNYQKLKGNIVDSKFTKASILGKPPLQPSRNHLVVRQPNAFTSERPRISRPRFASQVDEKNDLSKTVTPHYLPKVRESAAAKPHQVNAPNYSRNSHKESYGSNDMVHAYFLEDARKMTQDKTRIPNHRDMASTRAHCTPNACTPKPRNIYMSSPVSKCSGGMSNGVPLVDHSRNSSFFLDSKQFFSPSRSETTIPLNQRTTHKPGRQIGVGQRFSLNKSSVVHEKPNTPRSCLKWKSTGRIFKTVSLRWIPTGKMFTDSTTKVDSEPPNDSNDDITNPYECNQTLYFSACTSNSSACTSINPLKERLRASLFILMTLDHSSSSLGPHCLMMSVHISSGLVLHLDDQIPDDDDEGPSAGSNQGKSTKRRRHDSGASGSAQPPTKDDEQSSKKPRKSDASASKQHPALPSTGWKITDTRDADVDSSMHRSDPESEQSEQSSDNIPMQDEGHVSDLEDTDNAHIPKVSTTTWFKPIPEGERPATSEPEWTIPPNDFPEPENNWANTYATTYQVPTENKLQRKTYDIGSFIKWFCRQTGKKKICKADLEDVDSEHFDRDDNTGDDNEETKPDPEEIYNSGPAPSLMTPGYISSGLVQISVSPTPYVPPSKKDYEILTRAIYSWPTDHSVRTRVHEMIVYQIRSDLTPNRQETSVDNISSDLISNKQKALDYDIFGPVPPRKNVVSLADKTDSSQKEM
ncbi:hypothetical protein Tco_0150564 [Tanacetum coccineum]